MITVLQWTVVAVCVAVALVRIPDALRGRNRTTFGILVLAALCALLTVPGPYEAIDRALGGWNFTNLILRYLVNATVLLVGMRIAKGLGSVRTYKVITGRTGRWILLGTCVSVTAIFGLLDTRGSSAGLMSLTDQGGTNAALAPFYAAAGRAYPAFVSIALMPALLQTVRQPVAPAGPGGCRARARWFSQRRGECALFLPAGRRRPAQVSGQLHCCARLRSGPDVLLAVRDDLQSSA